MFIAVLFTTAWTRKQLRCSLTEEWIKKMSYIYTKEYNSAINKNECVSVPVRWMNLEPVMLDFFFNKFKKKLQNISSMRIVQNFFLSTLKHYHFKRKFRSKSYVS